MTIIRREVKKEIVKPETHVRKTRNESIADDSHNLWYSFASEVDSMLEEQGVYCDIWINDMGYMEITNEDTGKVCTIYTKVFPDGRFMSQQLMIQTESGGFKAGEIFDTGEAPSVKEMMYDIAWISIDDVEECNTKKVLKSAKRVARKR